MDDCGYLIKHQVCQPEGLSNSIGQIADLVDHDLDLSLRAFDKVYCRPQIINRCPFHGKFLDDL